MPPAERHTTGYLGRVLASGARQFQFRAGVRTLLTGVGADAQLGRAPAPPPLGFTYAHTAVELVSGRVPEFIDAAVHAAESTLPRPAPYLPEGSHRRWWGESVSSRDDDAWRDRTRDEPSLPPSGARLQDPGASATLGATSGVNPKAASEIVATRSRRIDLEVPTVRAVAAPAPNVVASVEHASTGVSTRDAGSDDLGLMQRHEPDTHVTSVRRSGGVASDAEPAQETRVGARRLRENVPPPSTQTTAGQAYQSTRREPIVPLEPGPPPPPVSTPAIVSAQHVEPGPARKATRVAQDHRGERVIEQLRSSVQALMAKAIAAKPASADTPNQAPSPQAARPAQQVIVVNRSAGRPLQTPAYWERRNLGRSQFRVFR